MRIVHFSDWHARSMPLPPADIYVCTGDMLPDVVPELELAGDKEIPRLRSRWQQAKILANKGCWRKLFARIEAPVLVVRGNHDWVWLSKGFGGEVYEFGTDPEVFEVKGLRFGGMRGIKQIAGTWSDELDEPTASDKIKKMPKDIDVLITHSPPKGYKDKVGHENVGLQSFSHYINSCFYHAECRLSLHLFGHVHGEFGVTREGDYGFQDILFSNAATGFILLEDRKNDDGSISWNVVTTKRLPRP